MKKPSPAFLVAGLALFVSFGGTGYAASQLRSPAATAASTHKQAALSPKQVEKLIGAYIRHHHIGARGPQGPAGPQGASGAAGGTGPQGPGAQRIDEFQVGEVTGKKFAALGPWTLSMTCRANDVLMTINGPGEISYTESLGAFNETATTVSNSGGANGFTSDIANHNEQGIHAFLTSGASMEELSLEISDLEGHCGVVGDAIPAS